MVNNTGSGSKISATNETIISKPVPQEGLPVSWSDWDFVKSRIKQCQVSLDFWGYLTAFFSSATLGTFAIAWADITDWRTPFFIIAIASFLLALFSFIARFSIKRVQGNSIKTVLQDMEQIERRYQRPPTVAKRKGKI